MSNMKKHYTVAEMTWRPASHGDREIATLTLNKGDTAERPGSDKIIVGPIMVMYSKWSDGGIGVTTMRM